MSSKTLIHHSLLTSGNTERLYPGLNLTSHTEEDAVRLLVARHIASFGPVSLKDIVWWSGLGISKVRNGLSAIESELVSVDVEAVGDNLWLFRSDLRHIESLVEYEAEKPWAALLAYEDSSLKGYFDTRSRYVDEQNYDRLFNQIGEVRAGFLSMASLAGFGILISGIITSILSFSGHLHWQKSMPSGNLLRLQRRK